MLWPPADGDCTDASFARDLEASVQGALSVELKRRWLEKKGRGELKWSHFGYESGTILGVAAGLHWPPCFP